MSAGHWGFVMAGAVSTPVILSHTIERQLIFAGVTYARDLHANGFLALAYTSELIPFMLASEPHEEGLYYFKHSGAFREVNQGPATIYSAGASPVGFRLTFRPTGAVAPYLSTSGGFLLSSNAIPYQVEGGTRFNFTFHFGAGVRLRMGKAGEARIGYRWTHISNAYRTAINAGIDANVFEVAFSFR